MAAQKLSMRAPCESKYRAMSRRPTWDAPPKAVSQSPWPQSHAAITNLDRKSTRLNSSHVSISYAVFCLKKKKDTRLAQDGRRIMTVHAGDQTLQGNNVV